MADSEEAKYDMEFKIRKQDYDVFDWKYFFKYILF